MERERIVERAKIRGIVDRDREWEKDGREREKRDGIVSTSIEYYRERARKLWRRYTNVKNI